MACFRSRTAEGAAHGVQTLTFRGPGRAHAAGPAQGALAPGAHGAAGGVFRAGSGVCRAGRRQLRADPDRPHPGVCAGRRGAEPGAGLWRHGQLRARHVHGPGRLCGGRGLAPWPGQRRGAPAAGAGADGAAGGAGGADRAAHPGHCLHHDHAGLCADAVLRHRGPQAIRRRRRAEHCQAVQLRRAHGQQDRAVCVPAGGAGRGAAVAAARGGLALRAGAARHHDQRKARARRGHAAAGLSAGGLRGVGAAVRAGGLFSGQPHRLCLARLHGLDGVGRADRDGAAGRHGHAGGPGGGRVGVFAARGGPQGPDRPLAGHHGTHHRADRAVPQEWVVGHPVGHARPTRRPVR